MQIHSQTVRSVPPRRGRGGFTLIELLIVIAIILILIAIALPNFLEAQMRAKVVRVKADLRTIHTAMETYLQDWNVYPPDSEDEFDFANHGLGQLTTPLTYLKELPFDIFVGGSGRRVADGTPVFFEMGSTGPKPSQVMGGAKAIRGVNAFALYSHGPNVIDDFNHEQDWPWGGASPQCSYGGGVIITTSFTPTNGTKSMGNVHEFGGSWTAGHWCLDNVEIYGAFWENIKQTSLH
jgi:prepilin-type N-terminal cleavage/methylation domain-containing protein